MKDKRILYFGFGIVAILSYFMYSRYQKAVKDLKI
jgi:uncharacterized membrane protein